MKPNICICEDGRIAPSCAEAGAEDQAQDCSGTDEDPRVADPHSFHPDPDPAFQAKYRSGSGSNPDLGR